jgi:hypothetical protein
MYPADQIMVFWLLSFGIAGNPQILEVSLGAYESEAISLENDDAFFINSFETNVEFTQEPAATHGIEFVAGTGYAFRGISLIVRSRSAEPQSIKLWMIPKGMCPYNNFILIPFYFSLLFKAESFSQFCLFSPLNATDSIFQIRTENRVDTIAACDGSTIRMLNNSQVVTIRKPFMLFNTDPENEVGRFTMEIEMLGQRTGEVKPIVDTGESQFTERWAQISQPLCSALQDPAFSLPLACVITTLIGIGIGVAFQKFGWIDIRKLLGPGESLPEEAVQPPVATVEDHLDIREIENPAPSPPEVPEDHQA